MIARTSIGLLLTILLSISCDRSTTLETEGGPSSSMVSIAHLKSLCRAESHEIRQPLHIEGRITANNRHNEFPYALVLEDPSGGIVIHADYSKLDLGNDYAIGRKVTVACNGLLLFVHGDKVELGKLQDDGSTRIPHRELHLHLLPDTTPAERLSPRRTRINALQRPDVDTYLRFDHVHFVEQGCWCDIHPETGRPVTTLRTLEDDQGHTLKVRTLGGCSYAKEPLPTGNGSLCGILDYFAGEYTLRITAAENQLIPATYPTAYPSTAGYPYLPPTK